MIPRLKSATLDPRAGADIRAGFPMEQQNPMDPQTVTAYAVTILILAAIVAGWAYLRRMLANDDNAAVVAYIQTLVKAAEQQFSANDERRAWVVAQVRERYPKIPIDLILAVLEAAVYDLNQEQAIDAALEAQPAPDYRIPA